MKTRYVAHALHGPCASDLNVVFVYRLIDVVVDCFS